jgi:hypothetical protein
MPNIIERKPNTGLSKSSFLRGLNCPKSLFLSKYHPELKDEISDSQLVVFARGTEIGVLARSLFPGGVDAGRGESETLTDTLRKTREAIESGATIIYEAAFQFDGIYVAVDVLVKQRTSWVVYEVKSSASVKDENIEDVSIQYYVLRGSGLRIADTILVHLNTSYVRRGKLRLKSLFSRESLLREVRKRQKTIPADVIRLKSVLSASKPPSVDIGPFCSSPHQCDFMGHCWDTVPVPSVFDISSIGKKAFDLYHSGVHRIEETPDDFPLSRVQRIQVEAHKKRAMYVDKERLAEFLHGLRYPLYFIDFESIGFGIPIYDESRSYQQIVFQFSLHIQELPGSEPRHIEFLAEPGEDPRPAFIKAFLEHTKGRGSLVVYSQFEKTCLNHLARDFPRCSRQIKNRAKRIVDLMTPFQGKAVYHPAMTGSYSIKDVLPTLVADLNYDALKIRDGMAAGRAFLQMSGATNPDVEGVRIQLLEYCEMDSLAMVRLVGALTNLVKDDCEWSKP